MPDKEPWEIERDRIAALPTSVERFVARNGRNITEPVKFSDLRAMELDGDVSIEGASSRQAEPVKPAAAKSRKRK